MPQKKEYDASSIDILEGLEAVRKRPGMYIGSTSARGLHHLVWEILDNSIDESLIGECSVITLKLCKDNIIEIKDNGRGMPVDIHPKAKIPAERVIFTVLHAGGKFGKDSYAFSGGLHGVGASVVNALSEWLEVTIMKNGWVYQDRYEKGGKPCVKMALGEELKPIKKTTERGTIVRFKPDALIFDTVEFNAETIKKRIKELSYLNPKLKIIFINEFTGEEIVYEEKRGLAGLIHDVNKDIPKVHQDIICFEGEASGIKVRGALQFTRQFGEIAFAFTNNISNIEGGTHITGFKGAFTRLINQYARELNVLKAKDENFTGNDVRNGIVLVVSIYHPEPQFEGQTKTKLGNADARQAVEEVVSFELQQYFDRNIPVLEEIVKNAKRASDMRRIDETKKKAFLNANDSKFETNKKLASCESKDPALSEIFYVEGDSAGGSAKFGRNRKFQAILPLKGKPINVEKMQLARVLENEEVATIIMSLGTGYGEDFDIKKLRYNKIFIMTDADVDGAHIKTLLLTLFYRLTPELLTGGHIYIAIPPLYKFSQGNNVTYLYSDKELEIYKKKNKTKAFTIQRYKGLGEMNPEQLWETTMDPASRYIKQVTIEDLLEVEEVTVLLMGSNVPPRREFIEKEALFADLDL